MKPRVAESIMIVGFDTYFCYLMKRYVRMSARKLIFANRVEDILTQAQRSKPCVIFIEVDHPGTVGWKILHDLKENELTCHLPVVVCSWQDEELRSKQEGADVYLRLPVLYEHFKLALERVGAAG